MATFKINVHNKSATKQNYMFFNALPGEVAGSSLYSNVWVTANDIDSPHGTTTLNVKEEMFAVCGTAPSPLAEGVTVSSSDYTQVQLTSSSGGGTIANAVVDNGGITIGDSTQTMDPPVTDAYRIDLNGFDAPAYPNIFVGHGKYDGSGNVVPVATWIPSSLSKNIVQPQIVFYVATGSYQQGTCVDVTKYGPVGKIDFSKAEPGQFTADITQNPDNSWGQPVFT